MNVSSRAWRIVSEALLAPRRPQLQESLAASLERAADVWPQIVWLADSNYVTPAFWHALSRLRLTHLVPADAAQYLEALHAMNDTRNAALRAQLDEILRALNRRDVVPLLFKGAAYLRAGMYPNASLRILADLDLLIPGDQLLNSQKALSELGYDPLSQSEWDYSEHHHLPPLFRAGEYGSVELHHEPTYFDAQRCLRADEVWKDCVEHTDGQLRYRVPSPTHSVLLAFLHSEVSDRNLQRFLVSLRTLQDLAALTAAYGETIDWQAIHRRLQDQGYAPIFRHFLYVAARLAGIRPLPLRFGVGPRLRYAGCRLHLRHAGIGPWIARFERLSTYHLRLLHGENQTFLSLVRHRLRGIGASVARRLGKAVRHP